MNILFDLFYVLISITKTFEIFMCRKFEYTCTAKKAPTKTDKTDNMYIFIGLLFLCVVVTLTPLFWEDVQREGQLLKVVLSHSVLLLVTGKIYLSIYLSIHQSIYLSIHLSIDLSIYLSIYLSLHILGIFLKKGLAAKGLLITFSVTISDR